MRLKQACKPAFTISATVFLAAQANSDVIFKDGDFANVDWFIQLDYQTGTGGTVTAEQQPTEGNPLAYREVVLNLAVMPGALCSFHRRLADNYEPAISGAIVSVDYGLDRKCIATTGNGCRQVGLAFMQDGELYIEVGINGVPNEGWVKHAQTGLQASAFGRVDQMSPGPAIDILWDQNPDFTSGGTTIWTGFFVRGNSPGQGNGGDTTTGHDNWQVVLHTACPWDCSGDNDGDVGITDFLLLLAQWGSPGSCDFDGGGVGINDFLDLLANWGSCP